MRTPAQSRVEMTQIVMPSHMNYRGSLFGGIVVQWIDVCSAVAAMRHAQGGNCVTASIDRLHFLSPIHLGDIVLLQAQVNFAGRTSMEVGCRVETENPKTGERAYCTKAYLTFVALDEDQKPKPIPELTPQTEDEQRRFRDAQQRREERLAAAGRARP